MNWSNLKNFSCPKCSHNLQNCIEYFHCSDCSFSINKNKFDEIVTERYRPIRDIPQDDEDSRLAELNNLDRKEVGKGFLD